MQRRRLPYISEFKDRHGKYRVRFRRGNVSVYITSRPIGGPEFVAEYQAILANQDPRTTIPIGSSRTKPGSINALIAEYYQSPHWDQLSQATQQTYRNIIERFRERYGDLSVSNLPRRKIQELVDKKKNTPAAANNFLSVLKVLMKFAIRQGYREDNPTTDVEKIKYATSGFHTWTEDEIKQWEDFYPINTNERLAMALLLFTGQRRSDVIGMGPQHVKDGRIVVIQQKTGVRLEIPLHPNLAVILKETEVDNLAFLVTRYRRPYTAAAFTNWFRKSVRKADLPDRCVPHGLRKAAARRLAEAGCTPHEIMSITGHQTLKEVERYTKAADQVSLAETAIGTLSCTDREQRLSNSVVRLDKKTRN